MINIRLSIVTLCISLFALVPLAHAQQGDIRDNALSVFIDCDSRACDNDVLRTEINYVNWVRDRTLADVHLIVTFSSTGGGGQQFVLDFIGLGELEGSGDTYLYLQYHRHL